MKYLLLACLCLGACAPNHLVRQATATDTYYQTKYMKTCVEPVGPKPETCGPCQQAVNDAAWQVPLANQVYKIDTMPKKEQDELKDLIDRLNKCP